jgi:TetR/AcrR family transcriptional repressor of nem operon
MVRRRDPEWTRGRLLEAAFSEIYAHGYNATSMDQIVARSGVTKGALYHHFGSKKELAQAMIDETIRYMVVDSFLDALNNSANPIDGMQSLFNESVGSLTPEQVSSGCPLNNLAQELSGGDNDFQEQIDGIYELWRESIADALARAQQVHQIRSDGDPHDVATFTVAAVAGIAGFAKSTRDVEVARSSMRVLCAYLDTLRHPA